MEVHCESEKTKDMCDLPDSSFTTRILKTNEHNDIAMYSKSINKKGCFIDAFLIECDGVFRLYENAFVTSTEE